MILIKKDIILQQKVKQKVKLLFRWYVTMVEKRILKNGSVTIPQEIRDRLDIHEGDKVCIDSDGNNIIISKKINISKRLKSIAEKHDSKIRTEEIKESLKERCDV